MMPAPLRRQLVQALGWWLAALGLAWSAHIALATARHAHELAEQDSLRLRKQAERLAEATHYAPRLATLHAAGLLTTADAPGLAVALSRLAEAIPEAGLRYRVEPAGPVAGFDGLAQALPVDIEFSARHEPALAAMLHAIGQLPGRPTAQRCEVTRASVGLLARCRLVRLGLTEQTP
ncbi:hypothetical protein [Chitiniphilus shinanonensis]|uniref:hypothetical protein n=1 Tax=Chitiniphilus shinanonensis TaxID=553088 RepID=UPI0030376D97